jgi:hypothetical protein
MQPTLKSIEEHMAEKGQVSPEVLYSATGERWFYCRT